MTERELQRLGRRELLQLLLDQAKETEQLRAELAGASGRARELEDAFEQLREQLNEKDARLRELEDAYDLQRDQLAEREAQLREQDEALRAEREGKLTGLSEAGSIAEAALRISGVFEAAQRAADLYLQTVRESSPPPAVVTADTEPKLEQPVQPPPPPDQSALPLAARDVPPKRGIFQEKKRGDNKWKFVLSFGVEQD